MNLSMTKNTYPLRPHYSNGRELVLAALRHEETPAVPWIPFAGVHAGRLKRLQWARSADRYRQAV